MKNTHLEHPEDSILLGRQFVKDVISFLKERNSKLSIKYDGSPAIVWGTNPENGKFFVGTKSVFNKVKVKINYTHHDIEVNHGNNPRVASILHVCMDNLPKLYGIFQGDFIGFGGNDYYCPNTIEYVFSSVVDKEIVFAAHTEYTGNTIKELSASFGVPFYLKDNFLGVKFLNTDAQFAHRSRKVDYILNFASLISNFIKYPDKKEVAAIKIAINKCIREGRKIDCIDGNLLLLFNLITKAKELLMKGIETDKEVDCYINGEPTDHEGYVMSNQYGTFKLVNRRIFSYNNFNLPKNW